MDIKQIIEERLKVLPEEIKTAIKSTDLAVKFNNISEKHNLLLDKNAILQNETMFVMLGLESTNDFVRNIERELDISRNEAVAITMDVNKEIFDPLRSVLQKMQEEVDFENEIEEEADKRMNNVSTIETIEIQKPQTDTQNPIKPTPSPTVTPQINNTPSQNTEPPVFVAKTIAIPKPEPVAIPAIRPKTLDEAGRFTIEKPPVGIPQYKDELIKKEVILGMIEDEKINDPEPITISVPSYIPEKSNYTPPTPTPTPTPVQTNTETPIVKAPPQTEKKSYTVDPYREQI